MEAEATFLRAAQIAADNARRHAAATLGQEVAAILPPPAGENSVDRWEQQRKNSAASRCWELACVPDRYQGVRFGDLSAIPDMIGGRPCREPYAAVATKLLRLLETPAIVGLIGPRGTGKSAIACGLVREFCRAARLARYCDAVDIFVAVKESFGAGGKNQSQVEAQYIRPDLLVIDEIHERGDTVWEDRMLTRIINKRYLDRKATILIGNQTAKQFMAGVGESVASRILDQGGLVECNWPGLRGHIQNQKG